MKHDSLRDSLIILRYKLRPSFIKLRARSRSIVPTSTPPSLNRLAVPATIAQMSVSGVGGLAGISTLMLVGAYLAGLLPAVLKLSKPRHLQLVSRATV